MKPRPYLKLATAVTLAALAACSSQQTSETNGIDQQQTISQAELENRQATLDQREQELIRREAQLSSASTGTAPAGDLLPPNAKIGECYARAWVEPRYEIETSQLKIRDASEQIKLIPAEYEWVEKDLLVKEASSRVETTPAVYRTETEKLLVKEERNSWRTDSSRSAAPASDKLLAAAKSGGIDLASATPGMCFHEHFLPAEYRTVNEEVLASEASTKYEATPAEYEWVEEQVLVSEASFRMEKVPAVFETETETVVDKPAHTVWKKGTGPIQRIDEATGEIMCLVEVPATYKQISKRVLKSPATTRRVEIPAKYETVKVRKLVSAAGQRAIEIPATYKAVSKTEMVADEQFVWHEIHDLTLSADSRTGAKICLVNEPAQYKTVSRQVVAEPASTRTIEIPAVYEKMRVKQLASEAREERIQIPAEYRTVSQQKLVEDGHMEWRSILCETNMTRSRIGDIQRALNNEGYDPGPIDGVIGAQTMTAVNQFQRDKSLPVDRYLNIETLNALGVSPR